MNVFNEAYLEVLAISIAFLSLVLAFFGWRRSFRPIVTVAVKTHDASDQLIAYDLVVLNSGTLPAKNIHLTVDERSLALALGRGASEEDQKRWLACFRQVIPSLQNNDNVSCSFGYTNDTGTGFWKPNAALHVTIKYRGWFGWWRYRDWQELRIVDSASFTGFSWGNRITSGRYEIVPDDPWP